MSIPTIRFRNEGILSNVTALHVNRPPGQPQPQKIGSAYRLVSSIKIQSKYSPAQKRRLKDLLASYHRATVLRISDSYVDENCLRETKQVNNIIELKPHPKPLPPTGAQLAENYAAASQINKPAIKMAPFKVS